MDTGLFLTGVEIVDTQVPPIIVAAPSSLAITNHAAVIDLSWTNNDTYSLITIDRATESGDFTSLTTVSTGTTTYEDSTVVVGVTYSYKVRGLKSTYPTPYSNTVTSIVTAASFAASSTGSSGNFLSLANPSTLSITKTTPFIFGGWFKLSSLASSATLFTKGSINLGSSGTGSYGLEFFTGGNYIGAFLQDDGTGQSEADTNETFLINTKYFIMMYFDGNNQLSVQSGNNPPFTLTLNPTPSFTTDTNNITVFADDDHSTRLNGILDEWFFCKNMVSLTNALNIVNTTIWNSGNGIHYSSLSPSDKTTLGLISWWGFDEASGATRKDLNGSNDLTLNGTITQVTPLVS